MWIFFLCRAGLVGASWYPCGAGHAWVVWWGGFQELGYWIFGGCCRAAFIPDGCSVGPVGLNAVRLGGPLLIEVWCGGFHLFVIFGGLS